MAGVLRQTALIFRDFSEYNAVWSRCARRFHEVAGCSTCCVSGSIRMSMTLRLLEVFVSVAKHLSITRAARELCVTQPSVSHDLRRLQQALGCQLIKANARGVELTAVGVAVLAEAKSILERIGSLQTQYRSASATISRSLVVGANHDTSSSIMPILLNQFSSTYPQIRLQLCSGTNSEIERLIVRGALDLGIVNNPQSLTSLQIEPFGTTELCAIVPVDYSIGRSSTISLHQLAKLRLIIRIGKGPTSEL